MSPQIGQLRGTDPRRHAVIGQQAELVLRLGQSQPEPSPGAEFALGPPELGHLPTGVARHERVVVHIFLIHAWITALPRQAQRAKEEKAAPLLKAPDPLIFLSCLRLRGTGASPNGVIE